MSTLPLVASIDGRLTVSPFLPEPALAFELAVDGMNGAQLEGVLPGVAERVDASMFEGGSFTARGNAHLRLRRRGPVDFDRRRAFGAEIVVSACRSLNRKVKLRLVAIRALMAVFRGLPCIKRNDSVLTPLCVLTAVISPWLPFSSFQSTSSKS